MKKFLLLGLSIICFTMSGFAQKSLGGEPYSYTNALGLAQMPTEVMPLLDMAAIEAEDQQRAAAGSLRLISRLHQVNLDLDNSGTWTELANGDRLWRLKVESRDAIGLMIGYKRFQIPQGGLVYLFNEDMTEHIGAFSSINNPKNEEWATTYIRGERSIIEYYEPAAVRGEGVIQLEWVSHIYRDLKTIAEEQSEMVDRADPCEVNIMCSEGEPYWDEKKGIVRIAVIDAQGQGWCSGSLVNNTAEDCKPYILSALHCANNSSTSHFNQFIFTFNYERVNCTGGPSPNNNTETGCTKRADSNDNGGATGSDFLLVELNGPITESYYPYWNGWNANNSASPSGVCIHHPAGDNKKISTYTQTLVTTGWGVSNTHWQVRWVATANGWGVTEGGSSGSPLFNNRNRAQIIGTLTGGSSYCEQVQPGANDDPDWFGKMSWHWSNNPNAAGQKLSAWLDPTGSGAMEMDGSFQPCGTFTGMAEKELEHQVTVMPNPNNGLFQLEVDVTDTEDLRIEVYNTTGQLIHSFNTLQDGRIQIDLTGHATGIYYVNVNVAGAMVTRKVMVQ